MIRSLVIKYCSLPDSNVKFIANYGLYVKNLNINSNLSALCFGLHDNIEFEKGLADLFNFQVFAFDPTPISKNLFSDFKLNNFHYYPYAISLSTSRVKFYMNSNLDNSGGSIINNKSNSYELEVDSYTYVDLLEKFSSQKIELLKMDIDGGEIDIINDLYTNHLDLLPNQITLEIDVKTSNLLIIDSFLFNSKKYYNIFFIPHKVRYSSFELLFVKTKI
jgi:FkbM family methyltransferase